MIEKRIKLNGFQAKQSEHDRITETAKRLNMSRSEFLRVSVISAVEKQERKMKG